MTEPHRDFGSVVELRSSKEIVASLGWLKDLPTVSGRFFQYVNRLQFFFFSIIFPIVHVNFVNFCWRCLAMLIAAGHNLFS